MQVLCIFFSVCMNKQTSHTRSGRQSAIYAHIHGYSTTIEGPPVLAVRLSREAEYENRQSYFSISM